MKTKRIIQEILLMVVISSLFGILYNFYSSKPIPLIRQPKIYETATDSLINSLLDSTFQNEVTLQTLNNNIDTIKTKKEILSDTSSKLTQNEKPTKELNNNFTEIKYEQIKKYLNNPKVIIIDARTKEKYLKAHIGNAINLYALQENQNEYLSKLTQLPLDKIIIVYCDGGECDLSHHVVNDLINFNFKKVFIYLGGWEDWEQKNSNNQ